MAPTAYISWKELCSSLDVSQTWYLSLLLKLQNKSRGLLHRQNEGCVSSAICKMLWEWQTARVCLSNCQSSIGSRSASLPGQQSQVTKGCPLVNIWKYWGARCKNQGSTTCRAPLQETLACWNMAEGEAEDTTHPPRSLERIIFISRCIFI